MLAAQHPAWLILAALLAALGTAAALTQHRRSWRWRAAGILLPATAAVAIALALADISLAFTPRVVLLLDFSASTRTSPWRDPAWVCDLAARRLAPTQSLTVVAFAGDQQHILIPDITPQDSWPAQFDWSPPPTAGTDIAAALAWLSPAEESPTHQAPRWIITDGLFDATTLPQNPNRAWTVLPPTAPDATIRDLVLRPAPGGQVEVLVQLRLTSAPAPLSVPVTLRRDGTIIAQQSVSFSPGTSVRWLTLRDHPDTPPPHHYQAAIDYADPWPENNHAAALWPGTGELRTFIIGDQTPPNLPGQFLPTERFTQSPAQLAAEGWQLIVLNNVPAESPPSSAPVPLSPAAARALDRFVRENGAGLLILGTTHAFGPGRYGEGSIPGDLLEALSPVTSHSHHGNALGILFLLDASASMNDRAPGTTERKFTVLSHAVQDAATYLADNDALTILTFNSQAQLLGTGPARAVIPTLAPTLAAVEPSGPTNPDAALPLLADFLKTNSPHLIILLTDGEIPSMDIAHWKSLLQSPNIHLAIIAPDVRSSRLSVPGVATAPAETQPPLAQLAAALPNASWSQTDNPAAWANALRQAVLAQTRGTVQDSPLSWRTTSLTPPLTGIAPSWTRTWLKPESSVIAASPSSTTVSDTADILPAAAIVQRGLGKVAALPLADDASPAYQQLRQRLLESIAASPGDRRFSVTVRRAAAGWLVAADGIDNDTFLNGLSLSIHPIDSDIPIPLPQTAPGHYQAIVPGTLEGLAAVILRQNAPNAAASPQLIARIQSPTVETAEWPATVDAPATFPPGTTLLPPTDGPRWLVPATSAPLTNYFWILAALAALTALWLRK